MASTCSDNIASIAAMSRSTASRSACGSMRSRVPCVAPNHRSSALPEGALRNSLNMSANDVSRLPTKRPDSIASRTARASATTALAGSGGARLNSFTAMHSPSPCGRGLGGGGIGAAGTAPSPQPPPTRGGGVLSSSAGRGRDAGDHAQAGGQLFHLQPRTHIRNCVVRTRLAGYFPHLHASLAQREASLHLLPRILVAVDVVVDPTVQP